MIRVCEIPVEEPMEPRANSFVFHNEPGWDFKNKTKWSPRYEMMVLEGTEEDREHYVEFINGHFQRFTKDTCRSCRKHITPYKKKYYQLEIKDSFQTFILYSADNCYCEKCAKEKSKVYRSIRTGCAVVKREERQEFGGEHLEVVTYEDGSTLQEMTTQEKMAAGVI